MRGAVADHALDLGERAARRRWPAPARASDATARWCRAARRPAGRSPPSPASASSRARDQRLAQARPAAPASRQFGQAGAAQQRPQRRIAERGPVEFAEMGVAAMAVEQQRDRRRRTATGRPSGPSARGRRRRRNTESSCKLFRALPSPGRRRPRPARRRRLPKPASRSKSYHECRRKYKCDRESRVAGRQCGRRIDRGSAAGGGNINHAVNCGASN